MADWFSPKLSFLNADTYKGPTWLKGGGISYCLVLGYYLIIGSTIKANEKRLIRVFVFLIRRNLTGPRKWINIHRMSTLNINFIASFTIRTISWIKDSDKKSLLDNNDTVEFF